MADWRDREPYKAPTHWTLDAWINATIWPPRRARRREHKCPCQSKHTEHFCYRERGHEGDHCSSRYRWEHDFVPDEPRKFES